MSELVPGGQAWLDIGREWVISPALDDGARAAEPDDVDPSSWVVVVSQPSGNDHIGHGSRAAVITPGRHGSVPYRKAFAVCYTLSMTAQISSLEHAQLTVTRLNRAASDLGITLKGAPLFVLDEHHIDATSVRVDAELFVDPVVVVYDIAINTTEFNDYAELATALEKLVDRVKPALAPAPGPGQGRFFAEDDEGLSIHPSLQGF